MTDWQIQVRAPGPGGTWTVIPQHMDLWYRLEVNALSQITFSVPQVAGISAPNLFWNMETLISGLMDDISTHNNNGTITGTPTSVTGQIGLAREFTNSNAGAINNTSFVNSGIGTYTIALWFKQVSTPVGGFNQVMQISNANPTTQFTLDSSALHIVMSNSGGTQVLNSSIFTPVNGTWYHVALTYDGSTVKCYLNGALNNTFTSITTGNLGGPGFFIQNGGSATAWDYIVDEVYEFQSVVLTQNQISSLFNNTFVSPYLSYGNEVRVIDPSSIENVRGMIRESTSDPILKIQKVVCSGKAVRLQDRTWQSRRNFPTVSPSIVLNELMNSPEGEPSAQLILRYDMESLTSTGQLMDFGPNGNNGTISGTGLSSTTGYWGNAYAVAGGSTTQVITATASTNLNSLNASNSTLTFWFRVDNYLTNGDMEVFSKLSGTTGMALGMTTTTGGLVRWSIWGGASWTSFSGIAYTAGAWHHAVYTCNAGAGTLFVDGINTVSGSCSAGTNTVNATMLGFTNIAGNTSSGAVTIDELHVYNKVLSTNEINQLRGIGVLEGGIGTVDTSLPTAPPRAEGDRRLQVVDSYSRALGAEWYVNQNASDQDQLNVVSRVGSSTATQTFQLSKNCSLGNRQLNNDTIFNDITIFGVGDGALQLKSRNFSATTIRTITTAIVTASQTTSIAVTSTTGFSASGVIFIGMERIQYTGIDATHIGTTSITRAYQADGISSYSAYQHNSGIEVYLSFDGTNYWTSLNPQTNSQIQINGLRNGIYTDKTIVDQNTLDFLAYNFNTRYNNPRESLQITFPSSTLTAVLGDAVNVNDSSGNPYSSTPYRIIGLEWDWDSRMFKLELLPNSTPHASGGYIDSPSRRMAGVQESTSDLESYGVVGSYPFSNYISGAQTITTTTETAVNNLILQGIKNGTKLLFFSWADDVAGTAATQFTIRLRQGTGITGTIIASSTHTITAAQTSDMTLIATAIAYQDNPLYTLTLQQTSATGNGTCNNCTLVVYVSN